MNLRLPKELFETSIFGNTDDEDKGYAVTLKPKLSDYECRMEYDERGNANITIVRKANRLSGAVRAVVLDFCLDNGEINEMEKRLFEVQS